MLAATLLVVAASCEVTRCDREAVIRSSSSDSTLKVLWAATQHTQPATTRQRPTHIKPEQSTLHTPDGRSFKRGPAVSLYQAGRPSPPHRHQLPTAPTHLSRGIGSAPSTMLVTYSSHSPHSSWLNTAGGPIVMQRTPEMPRGAAPGCCSRSVTSAATPPPRE